MKLAFTRAVSPRLAQGELTHLERRPIDIDRAIAEHDAYEQALTDSGLTVEHLAPLDDAPDGVFVEDVALLLGEHAILTRPTASRRREVTSVAEAFAGRYTMHTLDSGALEGGDVVRIGSRLYVGLSARSDRAGIAALAATVAPLGFSVTPVELRGCLHLKTAATFAGLDGAGAPLLIHNPAWVDAAAFVGVHPLAVARGEASAANTLRLEPVLLIPAGNPRTRDAIAARGLAVVDLDISELQKAEAGLTCSSLIGD